MRRRAILAAVALATAVATALPSAAQAYGPPYALGPSTGDTWNVVQRDAQAGRMTVLRVYPIPGSFSCGGGAGQAFFRVTHEVTSAISGVDVAYDEALIDGFTFLNVLIRDSQQNWYGSLQVRGPIAGAGTLEVGFPDGAPPAGATLWIDFGLQTSSACPSVDGGIARFPSVTVT